MERVKREYKVVGDPVLIANRELNHKRVGQATEIIREAEFLVFVIGPRNLLSITE